MTTTDTHGRFVVQGIAPGIYRLTITARGYAEQIYGQRIVGGTWKPIELAPGQAARI
jgi:hypothetical protein